MPDLQINWYTKTKPVFFLFRYASIMSQVIPERL